TPRSCARRAVNATAIRRAATAALGPAARAAGEGSVNTGTEGSAVEDRRTPCPCDGMSAITSATAAIAPPRPVAHASRRRRRGELGRRRRTVDRRIAPWDRRGVDDRCRGLAVGEEAIEEIAELVDRTQVH